MQSGKCSVMSMILVLIVLFFLAVIFLPVGYGSYQPARKAICLNNIKQCGQALRMYADDYGNKLPSSYLVSCSKRWKRTDFLTFATKLGKIPPDGKSRRVTWSQILYDNMKSKDIPFCPSDRVDKTGPNVQTSYWYKLANDKAWYGVGCPKPRRLMGDYKFESDQVAFYEHWPWHFSNKGGLKQGNQVNVVFMDTHVESINIPNATSSDPINCAANSDGEPMYYNSAVNPKTGYVKTQTGPAKLIDPTYCYDTLP